MKLRVLNTRAFLALWAFSFLNACGTVAQVYCGDSNCYEVLGLRRDASPADIRSSFRKLSLRYHPDKNQGESAEGALEQFRLAAAAYLTLKEPEMRAEYDYILDHPEELFRKYATFYRRKLLGPQENVWIVVWVIITIATVLDVLYHNHRHDLLRLQLRKDESVVKRVADLRRERGLLAAASGDSIFLRKNGKKSRRQKDAEPEFDDITDAELDSVVAVGGWQGRKPTLSRLLVVRIAFWYPLANLQWLVWFGRWILVFWVMRRDYGAEEREYLTRRVLKFTAEHWDEISKDKRDELTKKELWVDVNFKEWKADQRRMYRQKNGINQAIWICLNDQSTIEGTLKSSKLQAQCSHQ